MAPGRVIKRPPSGNPNTVVLCYATNLADLCTLVNVIIQWIIIINNFPSCKKVDPSPVDLSLNLNLNFYVITATFK